MVESVIIEGSGVVADVKIDLWLRDILPQTPGVVRAVAKRELYSACREFFTTTLVWRDTSPKRNLTANKKRYYLSPFNSSSIVVAVLGVTFNGRELTALTRKPPRETNTSDTPTHYWLEAPDTVRLYPLPTTTVEDALEFYVALAPKQTVRCLPGAALTHYYDAIMDGVLARLFAHPAKPYTNPALGEYHAKRFRAAIGAFAAQGKKGFSQGATWSFPRFGK